MRKLRPEELALLRAARLVSAGCYSEVTYVGGSRELDEALKAYDRYDEESKKKWKLATLTD